MSGKISAQVVEHRDGTLTFTCGRCGAAEEVADVPAMLRVIEDHRGSCPAQPHCPTCRCSPRDIVVQRLASDLLATHPTPVPDGDTETEGDRSDG